MKKDTGSIPVERIFTFSKREIKMVTILIKHKYGNDIKLRAFDIETAIVIYDPFQTCNFSGWIPFFNINQLPFPTRRRKKKNNE